MGAEEEGMEGRALKCVVMVIEIMLSCGLGLWLFIHQDVLQNDGPSGVFTHLLSS